MIVRDMPNGQVLCLNQTTHAHMAEQFCRHWGNADFIAPTPYAEVMLAISQHDNGWYDWELRPRLCANGYPMDFLQDDDPLGKLMLWRLSVSRVYSQHPYAALLVGRHAAWLYQGALEQITDTIVREQTIAFIDDQAAMLAQVRQLFHDDPNFSGWLQEDALNANTRLLQFGDFAVLQVAIPWANERIIAQCPLNHREHVDIHMCFDDQTITFDPWPFGVERFPVTIHGKLLKQRLFPNETAYHMALDEAPLHQLQWEVVTG